jgi:uncharacterized protein (DUF1697 family)
VNHVALLRAVNVGGNNPVPMKALAALFEKAGCRDVRTYIQSGNVVFTPPSRGAPAKLPSMLASRIEDTFGFRVPVVVRTADELRAVVATNPLLKKKGAEIDRLFVGFLADQPDAARVASLDPNRSPPDEFVVKGREIFLHFPKGVGKTKITNVWLDAKLGTTSTVRNWKTVLKLVEMSADTP